MLLLFLFLYECGAVTGIKFSSKHVSEGEGCPYVNTGLRHGSGPDKKSHICARRSDLCVRVVFVDYKCVCVFFLLCRGEESRGRGVRVRPDSWTLTGGRGTLTSSYLVIIQLFTSVLCLTFRTSFTLSTAGAERQTAETHRERGEQSSCLF